METNFKDYKDDIIELFDKIKDLSDKSKLLNNPYIPEYKKYIKEINIIWRKIVTYYITRLDEVYSEHGLIEMTNYYKKVVRYIYKFGYDNEIKVGGIINMLGKQVDTLQKTRH